MTQTPPETEAFADTNILLNFVQQEWESGQGAVLIDSDAIDITVSKSVMEELHNVTTRRRDIYEDILDFLMTEEEAVVDYSPAEAHVYISSQDETHILNMQEKLVDIEDDGEVLRRVRKYVRAVRRRVEYLEAKFEDEAIDPIPPLELTFAVDELINHSDDAKIICDAAAWSAENGTDNLVTNDTDDMLSYEDEITEILEEECGPEWVIDIQRAREFLKKEGFA